MKQDAFATLVVKLYQLLH